MVAHAAAGAADTTQNTASQTAERQATVDVQPGDLKFQTDNGKAIAPSFNFGKTQVSNQTQTGLAADSSAGLLEISNMLGGSPWQINVKLDNFTGKNEHKITGAELNLTPKITKADFNQELISTPNPIKVTSGAAAVKLLSAGKDKNMGDVKASLDNATLDLPNATYSDHYTATLTYTLMATPQTAETQTTTPQS